MSINYCKKNNTFLLPKPTGKKSGTFTHRIYNEWNQAVCKSQTCLCCLWTNSFCVFFFGQSFQGRAAHECNTGVCKSFVFLETVNHMSLWQAVGSIPPTGGSNKSSCRWKSLFWTILSQKFCESRQDRSSMPDILQIQSWQADQPRHQHPHWLYHIFQNQMTEKYSTAMCYTDFCISKNESWILATSISNSSLCQQESGGWCACHPRPYGR